MNNKMLKDVVDATKKLHEIARIILEYDVRPEELEDLFFLKPDLQNSFNKIRDWVTPNSVEELKAAIEDEEDDKEEYETPSLELDSITTATKTVDLESLNPMLGLIDAEKIINEIEPPKPSAFPDPNEIEEKAIIPKKEEAPTQISTEDHDKHSWVPKKSDRSPEEQMTTLIEFVKKCDGMSTDDVFTKAGDELVKTGLVDYNRSYKFLSRRGYKKDSETIFEIKNNRIHVFQVLENVFRKEPEPEEEIKSSTINDERVAQLEIIGDAIFDKQEFLQKVEGINKTIYIKIAASIINNDGNVDAVIEELKPYNMNGYTQIAKVKSGLIAVGKYAEYDETTLAILICQSLAKHGKRKFNRITADMKNQYGIMVSKPLFDNIVNGTLHPEIKNFYCV